MIVLALDNGYIRIEEDTEPGKGAAFLANGKLSQLKVEPIGSIVIAQYEKQNDEYTKKGGSRADMLKAFSTGGIIKLSPPYYPHNVLARVSSKKLDLSDIPGMMETIKPLKVLYFLDDGKMIPAFEVDSIDELYFYDLMRLRAGKFNLRYCEDCGSIFPARTNAVRCEKCRAAGMGAKKKQNNIKADKARECLYRINNRNKNQNRRGNRPPLYLIAIGRAFEEHERSIDYMVALDRMDQWIYTVYKFLNRGGHTELITKLNGDFSACLSSTNPEKWLIEWMKDNEIYNRVVRLLPNKSKGALL